MKWKGYSYDAITLLVHSVVLLTDLTNLGKSISFSVLQFPSLENEDDDAYSLQGTMKNEDYYEPPTERMIFGTQKVHN